MNSRFNRHILASATLLVLTACGSDSDTSQPNPTPVNVAPTVSVENITALEGAAMSITASGQDTDGTIVSYAWTQKSGTTVELTGADTATVGFTAPAITADEDIELTITVTDNDGATVSVDVTASITANILRLTLQGIVTDSRIKKANIEVLVGKQTFTTIADEQGSYNILLEVDDSYGDQKVMIKALGDNDFQPEVEFVSSLASFNTLIEEASDDSTLNKIENFGVNVTNLTTADYALVLQGNDTIDEDEKLWLATLIKIIVDGKGDDAYELPSGVTSTLDLVDDSATAEAFALQVNADNPELITEVTKTITSDPSVMSEDTIVGTWNFGAESESEVGSIITFTASGYVILIETKTDDDCGQPGYDLGTYQWDESTGDLTVTINEDTNGCVGMHDDTELGQPELLDQSFKVTGNTLTVGTLDDGGTGQRIISDTNPLVGGYIVGSLEYGSFWHKVFINDTHEVTLLHTKFIGVNAATYNWDSTTGIFTPNTFSVSQLGESFEEQVYKPVDDILLFKDGGSSFVLKRTHHNSNQLYLTESDVVGSYTVTYPNTVEQGTYQIILNEDHSGIDSDSGEDIAITWLIREGQLIVQYNDLEFVEKFIFSPTNISNNELSFNTTKFELVWNEDGSETGLAEYTTETWTRN